MGENFFFVFFRAPGGDSSGIYQWLAGRTGRGVRIGRVVLILSLIGLRELIFNAVSPSLKNGIAAGIGLFIAFIGLQQAGVILKDPGTAVKLNPHFASPDLVVFFVGMLTTAVLHARRVRGSILWGIIVATALACLLKVALPQMPAGVSAARDVSESMLSTRFEFAKAFVALPLSLGSNIFENGCRSCAYAADAAVRTVTSFVESAAGVEAGGRTGLTGLVVAVLFLLALFFSPLIAMIGTYPPITAPALTIVGAMMMQNVATIEWKDYTESIPASLIIIGIPLSYSIADGLALGFISYAIIKACSRRHREIGWLTYLLAIVLVLYFVFVRSRMG